MTDAQGQAPNGKAPNGKAVVEIRFSGTRRGDLVRAEDAARRKAGDPGWTRPRDAVWHHEEDCRTLQLVPGAMHRALAHTGGFTLCPVTPPDPLPPLGPAEGPGGWSGSDRRLSERHVAALERDFQCRLPVDYRRWLLERNGGRPRNPAFNGIETGDRKVVDRFFGLSDADDGLLAVFDACADRVPQGLLPVGGDPFGNLFLLGLAGPGLNRVFFWNHEREGMDDAPDMSNTALVAPSFTALLNSLCPIPAQSPLPER